MPSLTQRLKQQKAMDAKSKPPDRPNNVVESQPDHKELSVKEPSYADIEQSISNKPEIDFTHCLFISDSKLTTSLQKHLSTFPSVREWDINFVNRGCADLYKAGIRHAWINIGETRARQWLELNLKKCDPYTTILVYSGCKRSKFLKDLDDVQVKIKIADLHRLRALTFTDLLEQSAAFTKIHGPVKLKDRLLDCFGCSSNLTKSQKKN